MGGAFATLSSHVLDPHSLQSSSSDLPWCARWCVVACRSIASVNNSTIAVIIADHSSCTSMQGATGGMKVIGTQESFGLDVELELSQVRKLKADVLQQMYEVMRAGWPWGLVVYLG